MLMSLDASSGIPDTRYSASSSSARAHRGAVKSVIFSPAGHHLVSFGGDGILRLWDAASGRLHRGAQYDKMGEGVGVGFDRKTTLAISDAGLRSVVFCPEEEDIRVFDLYTGIDLLDQDALKGHFQRVNFVALHPWHHELYSGGNDRNLAVWTYSRGSRESAFEQFLEDKLKMRKSRDTLGGGGDGGGKESDNEGQIDAYMDSWSDYSDNDG